MASIQAATAALLMLGALLVVPTVAAEEAIECEYEAFGVQDSPFTDNMVWYVYGYPDVQGDEACLPSLEIWIESDGDPSSLDANPNPGAGDDCFLLIHADMRQCPST